MPEPGAVAIAVLTYNGYDLARTALETLSTLDGWPIPTVVVDNGSGEPEGQRLAEEFGQPVESVRLSPNRGVAGGYNAGIAWAMSRGATRVLLLNNDVRVTDPLLLRRLLSAADPAVAAVAPLTVAGSGELFSAGGRLSMWTGRATHRRVAPSDEPYDATWLDGPCLLVSLDAVRAAGPLDESLWMYWEDVEWCLRAGRHGWRCRVQPGTRIVHLRGGTNARPQAEAMDLRNRLRVLRRYSSAPQLIASTAFFLAIQVPVFVARRARRGALSSSLRAVAAACRWNLRDAIRTRSWRGPPAPAWRGDAAP